MDLYSSRLSKSSDILSCLSSITGTNEALDPAWVIADEPTLTAWALLRHERLAVLGDDAGDRDDRGGVGQAQALAEQETAWLPSASHRTERTGRDGLLGRDAFILGKLGDFSPTLTTGMQLPRHSRKRS